MAFKVNYGLKKAERDRAKKAKQEAKARDRAATTPTDADNGTAVDSPDEAGATVDE